MGNFFQDCKVCGSDISIENKKFNLVKCHNCKLVFCETKYEDKELVKLYDQLYNESDTYDFHIRESNQILNLGIAKLGRTKEKVLNKLLQYRPNNLVEIGAGVGVLANHLKNLKVNYLGLELDHKTVLRAQDAGLNVKEGDFSLMENLNYDIDSICAFEVIEHIQDLSRFFNIANSKLSNGGLIGITVPNYDKRLNFHNATNIIFQSPPPIHLNFFTTESLKNIGEIYDLRLTYCDVKKYPYLNFNRISTYKNLVRATMGKYNGPTIRAIFKKE